jgi:NADH-quinone oxidoreductase subunit I
MILNKKLYETRGYSLGIIISLKVTILSFVKNLFFKKRITVEYPDEKYYYSDRFKGMPALTLKEDGSIRCNSCMLCSTICPSKCIHIFSGEHEDPKVEKVPINFEIELLRCIFCGMCEEVCPVDAIRMSNDYSMSDYAEKDWLVGIDELSRRKTLNNGQGIQSRVDDKDRLKLRL